jgi:autotransporter-associated beta strand protein
VENALLYPTMKNPTSNQSKIQRGVLAPITLLAMVFTAPFGIGQTIFEWNPNYGGTFDWGNRSYWGPESLLPVNTGILPVANDTANFTIMAGLSTLNLNGARTIGILNFTNTLLGDSLILAPGTGGTLTFNNGGTAQINKDGLGTTVINAPITLSNSVTMNVDDGNLILGGVISGANGFTKEGNGTLILNPLTANTYTGVTTLNGGITLALPQGNNINILGANAAGQHTVINAGGTFATSNDLDNNASGTQSTGGWGTINEAFFINGNGHLGLGALRKMMGREQDTLGGAVTLESNSRIHADFGTLALTGTTALGTHHLQVSGASFVSLSGPVTGSGTITRNGIGGFRLQGITAANTFSGAIVSNLGEVRADTSDGTTGANPYDNISALNVRNGSLNIFSHASALAVQNRVPDALPITLQAGRIRIENPSFNGTNTFAWSETVGAVTSSLGHTFLDFRDTSADSGTRVLRMGDFIRSNPSVTLQFAGEGNVAANIGTGALGNRYRFFNTALDTGVNTPFVGGWAYTNTEFVKYNSATLGGNGYRALEAADYAINTAESGWLGTQNVKITTTATTTLTANRSVQSLNMQDATARTLMGNAGTTLTLESGGLLTSGGVHVISVPFLTAGAGGDYHLYNIAWTANTIRSVITDNGANPVSLVKAAGGTASFLGGNTYTGTTYINEGAFREIIGARNIQALGSGNLTIAGAPQNQSVYETDRHFTRVLGGGVGEVQLVSGTGSGFSAYGAPVNLNFGGAGDTVVWGSAHFNPGIFTLNGGGATHGVTMINPLDLGGEQRYIRLDGNASGGNRAVLGTLTGEITSGGIVKRGGGVLFFDDAKAYMGGTVISEGELWLRNGTGSAGANVSGNDIMIGGAARLKIDGPTSIGSRQWIIMQNTDDNNAAAIAFGSGYGDGSGITIHGRVAANNAAVLQTGAHDIFLANQQTGNDRRNRIAVQISGNHNFSTDLMGQIKTVAPDVEAWFGADTGNGTYTGTTLTATGRTKTGGNQWFRLGSGGGTLTIANANVLSGGFPLIVGAEDQTGRVNLGGVVYLPNAQNYTGTVTQTVGTALTAGNLVGAGGVLVVGQNGALNAANNNLSLRGGEIRLGVDALNSYVGQTDAQYGARNLFVKSANATYRNFGIAGGYGAAVQLGTLTMRMDDGDRVFTVNSIGTSYMQTVFTGAVTLENGGTARSAFFDVGTENSYQSGVGVLVLNNIISQTGAGAVSLQKRNGGVLILNADNTYNGTTNVQQGRLVIGHTGAAGNAGTTINMNTNNDRRSDLEFRFNGAGPFTVDNVINTNGGNDGSQRIINVGPMSGLAASGQEVRVTSLISNAGGVATTGNNASAIWFDGSQGYRLTVTGATTLNRTLTDFRTRGALVTLEGGVGGAGALHKYEQGTLVLSGNNSYLGATNIYNGFLVLGHDNALGGASSAVEFRGSAFSQVLASGTRTITRNFTNAATGSNQTLGGLDAGAKTFAGNISLSSREIWLTAATGGDVTFSGTISGSHAINKVGGGLVMLGTAAGAGNSYTGATNVFGGTLVGFAGVSGSPFGVNGAVTVSDGALILQGGGAVRNVTTTGALNINRGNAIVGVNAPGAATQLTFGSLSRTNNGTLVLKGGTTDIGTAGNEKVSFTAAPALTNGTIGTWAAIGGPGIGDNSAHFAGFVGGNVVTATYGGTGDLDTATGPTQLFDADLTGGTLTGNRSVFAFRSNANVDLAGFTLSLGASNQAGIILNAGADIGGAAGSNIALGLNRLSFYTDDAAVSTLSVPIGNFRDNQNNTLSTSNVASPAVFIKFGPGTLEIANPQAFQGNIAVNQGTLSLTAANVIPTFTGLNAQSGSVVTLQPGATILLNGNDQEFGNLAGVNQTAVAGDFQNSGGILNLGSATLTVGREGSTQTFSGQLIGGAGSVLQKVGGGTLNLWNYNGNMPNSLDILRIDQGTVSSRNNDQSWATPTGYASAIPSGTSVELRGGTWQVRLIGDSTTNYQAIHLGNNVSVHGSNGVLSTVRDQGGASNKIAVFNDLTLRQWLFTATGDNANYARFDGAITLDRDARIQTDVPFILNGGITGNYSLTKTGASNLEIGANNSSWSGGTVLHDGTLLFGSRNPERAELYMAGTNLFHYSASANLGTGDIVVNRATAIRINAPSNILIGDGQRVQLFGAVQNSQPRVDLGLDAPITSYGLRSTSNGSLSFGLNDGFWANSIEQAMMGNGKWGLSAWATTFYTGESLGAGVDNVYRFTGSNGGALSITQSGALSGNASLQVGADMVPNGFAIGNANASVRLYGDQSYTGDTIVFRNREAGSMQNFLEFTGTLASPTIDVYGGLTVRGAGRLTNADGSQANTVNLYPGSRLRLDYNMDVNDSIMISRLNNSNLGLEVTENKWGNNEPMFLNGATLNLVSSSGRVNRERVGAITVRNGAAVLLERNGGNGQIILETSSITRSGQATFAVRENADELGRVDLQSQKFFIDNGTTMLDSQGLMPVWMTNPVRQTFLTYNSDLGVQNAAFTQALSTTDNAAALTFLNGLTATSVASLLGGADPTLAGTINVHALRVGTVADNESTFTGGQINIRSGGLIVLNNNAAGRVNFNTTNLYFGDGSTPAEAVIYNAGNNVTTRVGGVVTANGLTMHGNGNLQLTNTGNQISGNIQMNSGKLFLDGAGTAGSGTSITMAGDFIQNNDGNQMAELWLRTNNNANTTWTNPILIDQHVPYARIIGGRYTGTSTAVATNTIPSLTVQGTSTLQGTSLIIGSTGSGSSENTHDLHVSGGTTLGGSAAIGLRVEQGGRIFRLEGAVTGTAPIFKSGDGILRLDANNTGLTSRVTLNRGEIRGVGNNTNNFFGSGDYLLNFGTLRFSTANARSFFEVPGQSMTFGGGAVTLVRDRSGGGSNQTITIGAVNGTNIIRTMGGSDIRVISDSFGDNWVFESKMIVNDSSSFFNDNANIWLRDQLEGSGRLTRLGIWNLNFDNNAPNTNWSGTLDIQAGQTRMLTNNDTLGGLGSSILIHPTASLIVRTVGNLGTGNGITELRTTSATSHTVIGVGLASEFANLRTHFNGLTTIGNRNGVLVLGGGANVNVDPAMASFQNGNWYFGGGSGDGTLSANSVAPWGVGGKEFRIGGGGSTLTLNPATAGAGQFAGAGNRMILGSANNVFGQLTILFGTNGNNSYDGGTLVTRSRNMDGGFRGTALRLFGGQTAATTYRTPLGTGTVDVFGEIRIEGASGTARGSDSANANTWIFHPGSRIRFDNSTVFSIAGTEGRWADNAPITLNTAVIEMLGQNGNNAYNSETIGALTVMGGSEVVLRRQGANWAELNAGDLTRTGSATLMVTGMVDATNNATGLGVAGTASAMRFLVSNGSSFMNNNMVEPWIIDRVNGQFMKYDATLGFQSLLTGGTPSNYVATSTTALTAGVIGVNDGTRIVSLEGASNFTLGDNLDLYALRVARDINVAANGSASNIIIRSGGLTQSANTPTINANLYFGSALGDGEALIHASNNLIQINGKIFASQVTKFGSSELYIRSDQPQFSGNWEVNGGRIRFLTGGAPGSGQIFLNGSRMNDRDNTYNLTEILYGFNSGSPDLFTYTGGKITAYDNNRIYYNPGTDRLSQIPEIDLRTTNAVAGTGQEGTILFQLDNSRSTLRTGTVTLYDHYYAHINSFGTGTTTGVQFGSGTGAGGLNNQGLYDFRKAGSGVLTLGDISSTFTGVGRSLTFGEGGARVTHAGSFGSADVTANIEQGASMEIAVAGWSPLGTLVQQPGSMERWAVDGARAGAYDFAPGVHWQVFHNQTGTQTIGLDGGSIMGYLPRDWDHVGIIQQLGKNLTINLLSDSYLGQPYSAGNNSLWDRSRIYDLGKINQVDASNPNDVGLRGSYLQIHGTITGPGGLTKLGEDMILLTGANTYAGATVVENGILQIGRNNSLPVGTALVLKTTSGQFDLNGYDQEVASLSGAGGSVNNGSFGVNTLTVNQATDSSFGGTLEGNLTLRKTGAGTLTLVPRTADGSLTTGNGYRGGTELLAGVLAISADAALGWTRLGYGAQADNLRFDGGTLRMTAAMALHANRGILLGSGGGALSADATVTAQVNGAITGGGSLSFTGLGTVQLNSQSNAYSGDTLVQSGVLQPGGENALSSESRHVITGDTASGTLDLNGYNQVIGSLASVGSSQANATVALGANTLQVGADNRQTGTDYAGLISGTGTLDKVGYGTQVLSGDSSGHSWNTVVSSGRLTVAVTGVLSSGAVGLGTGANAAPDGQAILRLETSSIANAITIGTVNGIGQSVIEVASGGVTDLSGGLALNRDLFLAVGAMSTAEFSAAIGGAGRLTVTEGGTVNLTTANTFGSGASTITENAPNGGLIVRAGTVNLGNSSAAGAGTIELGDQTLTVAAVKGATTASVLTDGGMFNPTTDGAGGSGPGGFTGISDTIAGVTYAVGERILIKDEEGNPERNGIYTVVSASGGTMNLVRATDFRDTSPSLSANNNNPQIAYGTQVLINTGAYAGQTWFMSEQSPTVLNGVGVSPIRFLRDVAVAEVAVLQSVSGLTIANQIDVNANGAGTATLGGSFATGTGTFSGGITLRNLNDGMAESKTVSLTSASTTGSGVTFAGVLSEADPTAGTGDTLNVIKTGMGVVTLTAANTYRGTTTIDEGTLQLGDGGAIGSLNPTGAISVASGAIFAVNRDNLVTQGTEFSGAAMSGAGSFLQVGSGTTVLNAANTYTGGTAIDGGVLQVNSTGAIGTTGTVSFGGGVLQYTANNTIDYSGRISTAVNQAVNIDTNGQDVTFATGLSSSGGTLTKQGAGTLSLTAASTFDGGTTVSGGTLLANNTTGSATGSGAVSVLSGASLGGAGFIAPAIDNSIAINSGATLTVGNLADTEGSALRITTSGTGELVINGKVEFDVWSGTGAGDNSAAPLTADRLIIGGGSVVLGGTLAINNPNLLTNWAEGDIWRLFDWALATSVTGNFSNITSTVGNFTDLPDLSGDLLAWDTTNLYTQGTLSVVMIPEPSRALLVLIGLLGAVMRRGRRGCAIVG